jgi:hypothetical protein
MPKTSIKYPCSTANAKCTNSDGIPKDTINKYNITHSSILSASTRSDRIALMKARQALCGNN